MDFRHTNYSDYNIIHIYLYIYNYIGMANGCVVGAGQNGVHKNLDGQWPKGTNSSEIYNVQHPGLPKECDLSISCMATPPPERKNS